MGSSDQTFRRLKANGPFHELFGWNGVFKKSQFIVISDEKRKFFSLLNFWSKLPITLNTFLYKSAVSIIEIKKLPISLTKNSKEVSNSVWNEEQIGTCFNRWHSPTKHNSKTFEMLKVGYWYCKIIQPFLYPFLIELIQAYQ